MKSILKEYDTEYLEIYALLSLGHFYNKEYLQLEKSESPDWQSIDLDIGLEVSQAIDVDLGISQKIKSDYVNKGYTYDETIKKANNRFKNYSGVIRNSNGRPSEYPYGNIYGFAVHIQNMINCYKSKVKKLNNKYRTFTSNQLYMFTFEEMVDEYDVLNCIDNIDFTIYDINYDMVFVNNIERIFACDFVNRRIIGKMELSEHDLQVLKNKTFGYWND